MAVTLLQVIANVREILGSPLPQAPSPAQILSELEAEYQYITNRTNSLGDAWYSNSFTFNTVAGTRAYNLTSEATDFYKALKVKTVPSDTDLHPEFELEFVELEHFTQEWSWLGQNKGQLYYSSHDSQMIALYRRIGSSGEELWCELRPTPANVQTYQVLYQQGTWWDIALSAGTAFTMPHPTQTRYLELLVAKNLLPYTRWSYSNQHNDTMSQKLMADFEKRLPRVEKEFNHHIASLENEDVIILDSWAEDQGIIW